MSEFRDWYDKIPFFTKWWLTLTIAFSLVGKIAFAREFVLDFHYVFHSFQIWRPITALFFFPTSFDFLINCYFLYNYSMRLEMGEFAGKPADYLCMLLFNWFCCVLIGFYARLPVLMDPMVISVLYVWCQLNKDVIVSFWFGSRFKAMYLPWVLLVFKVVISTGGVMELFGIVIGHSAYFLLFKYPQEFGGPSYLKPPEFLKQMFPDTTRHTGFSPLHRVDREVQPNPERHNWGRGYTLGGN